MTPERWSDDRLDDLASQVRFVASLATQVATHHAEISGHEDDLKNVREAQREAMTRMERTLEVIGKTCEDHTRRVEVKVDTQAKKIETLTAAQRWTPTQWAAILGPTLTALIGAAALVLTRGT